MTSILAKFKTLHSELQTLLACPSPNPHLLQTKITQYIALMVEEDKVDHSQELMFDHFCECGGVAILSGLLKVDSLLAIRSYSLLFINLKNEMWVSFILCQAFVTEAIQTKCDADEEEWTEYFVSFLKSLSIRLNATQITLFFNKKCPRFPLVYEAMKFFNHPDFMVRTSVMNIILELMKINEEQTRLYFSRFPFSAYLVTFACEVHSLIVSHQAKITLGHLSPKYLESYSVDLSDYLYYFNDLMAFGSEQAVQIIENTFFSYIVMPMLKWLLSGQTLRVRHALLILEESVKIIKNPVIVDTITSLLLQDKVSGKMIERIQNEEVYVPLVYEQEFNPNEFYWSQYEKEITKECLKVFQDLVNFEVEFEEYPFQDKPGFDEEIGKISAFIGYDLLENKRINLAYPQNVMGEQADNVDNPFRKLMEELMRSNGNDEIILITNILYKLLEKKGSEDAPHFMGEFIQMAIDKLASIEWDKTKYACLQSCFMLLKLSMREASSIEFEEQLLHNYRQIAELLNHSLTADHITLIVDHFHKHHTLITRKFASPYSEDLPYAGLFLPPSTWADPNPNYSLPTDPLPLLIQHFILFRTFVVHYFSRFYDAEYSNFQQDYKERFEVTSTRWKKGERYRIAKKTLIPCSLDSRGERKGRKGLIIEDEHNLVVAEIDQEGDCRILANSSWKQTHLLMSKEDPMLIEIRTDDDRLTLSFEDAVRANTTLAELSSVRWGRYQEELSFLVRFVRSCLEE